MGIAHVQDSPAVTGVTSPQTMTLGSTPLLHNWLTVVIGGYNGSGPAPNWSIASGQGGVGTWTGVTFNGTFPRATVFYGQITATPSTTVAATLSGTPNNLQAVASEWSGIGAFDTSGGTHASSTSAAPGSLTPAGPGELFLVAFGSGGNGGFTAGPGGSWANLGTTGSSVTFSGLGAWLVSGSAENPTATQATGPWAASMVVFKPLIVPTHRYQNAAVMRVATR